MKTSKVEQPVRPEPVARSGRAGKWLCACQEARAADAEDDALSHPLGEEGGRVVGVDYPAHAQLAGAIEPQLLKMESAVAEASASDAAMRRPRKVTVSEHTKKVFTRVVDFTRMDLCAGGRPPTGTDQRRFFRGWKKKTPPAMEAGGV